MSAEKESIDPIKGKRAAYALNLCAVSVSQIVDYKDLNILEQEYNSIINNLNLENIEKHPALLTVLERILDTITFFRIQEGDRDLINQEYQEKIRNAVWSSAPNFGLIVSGGSVLTTAVSLVSQIGIGYMNYRRNLSEYQLSRKKQEWELQKSAIEQLNALRRELFKASWKLADDYNYPDEYRLTEEQINRFNTILKDHNEIRKFERLETIKEKFEAFPPFWYYLGNSANYVATSPNTDLSKESRKYYREKAKEYFDKFIGYINGDDKNNEYYILRHDQLAASCCLEQLEIQLSETNNIQEITEDCCKLLKKAVQYAGDVLDVKQMIAFYFLKFGILEDAAKLFKELVNESYNDILNAQFLSRIYVKQKKIAEYELLKNRVNESYLYPYPCGNENDSELEAIFLKKQRDFLSNSVQYAIEDLVFKYDKKFFIKTSLENHFKEIDSLSKYDFDDIVSEETATVSEIESLNNHKWEDYKVKISTLELRKEILNNLNEFWDSLHDINLISSDEIENNCEETENWIRENKEKINKLTRKISEKTITARDYADFNSLSLTGLFEKKGIFSSLSKHIKEECDKLAPQKLMSSLCSLYDFCKNNSLSEPNPERISLENTSALKVHKARFSPKLFGIDSYLDSIKDSRKNKLIDHVKDVCLKFRLETNNNYSVLYKGEPAFAQYMENPIIKGNSCASVIINKSFLILKENNFRQNTPFSNEKIDLIFLEGGLYFFIKNKELFFSEYKQITQDCLDDEKNILHIKDDYGFLDKLKITSDFCNHTISPSTLLTFILEIKSYIYQKNQKVDKFFDVLNDDALESLKDWFESDEFAMKEGSYRCFALLELLTDEMIRELFNPVYLTKKNRHGVLIQGYFCKSDDGQIKKNSRLISFRRIDTNIEAQMREGNGLMNI